MKKNTFIKLASAAAVVLIAVILMIINATVLAPERHRGDKTVSLSIVYADKTYEYENLKTDAETVADFLHEYDKALDLRLKIERGSAGDYVAGFKNAKEDGGRGHVYVFTVNGETCEQSISERPLADGDRIAFRFVIRDENGTGLAPSAGLQDKSVSAGYVAMWVCCSVAVAAGLALAAYALIEYLRDRATAKEGGHGN